MSFQKDQEYIYGGVMVDTEERAALDLPPGFGIYELLDVNKVNII